MHHHKGRGRAAGEQDLGVPVEGATNGFDPANVGRAHLVCLVEEDDIGELDLRGDASKRRTQKKGGQGEKKGRKKSEYPHLVCHEVRHRAIVLLGHVLVQVRQVLLRGEKGVKIHQVHHRHQRVQPAEVCRNGGKCTKRSTHQHSFKGRKKKKRTKG